VDQTKSATARVTVTEKRKDSKERKDIKDKDVEKVRDKALLDKVRDNVPIRGRGAGLADSLEEGGAVAAQGTSAGGDSEAHGQSFIRPEERPPVGEPKGTAKKQPGKRAKRRKSE
jgi:hypothetical protein